MYKIFLFLLCIPILVSLEGCLKLHPLDNVPAKSDISDCSQEEIIRYRNSVEQNQEYGEHADIISYHYRRLACWYFFNGSMSESIKLLEIAQDRTNRQFFLSDWCDGEMQLADIHAQLGNEIESKKHIDNLLKGIDKISDRKTRTGMYFFVLEKMAYFSDKKNEAQNALNLIQQMEKTQLADFDKQTVAIFKAYFLLTAGRRAEATETSSSINLNSNHFSLSPVILYCKVLIESGEYTKARAVINNMNDHSNKFFLMAKVEFHSTKGRLHARQGEEKQAISSYRDALSVLEMVRSQTFDIDKLSYLSQHYNSICNEALQVASQSKDYASVFYFMETAKNRVLRDTLGSNLADNKNQFNQNASKLIALKDKINSLEALQMNTSGSRGIRGFTVTATTEQASKTDINDKISLLRQEYARLYNSVQDDIPFGVNKHFSDFTSIADVQNKLSDNEVIVEYFLGEKQLYILLIKPHEVYCYSAPYSIDDLRSEIENVNFILSADVQIQKGSNEILHEKLNSLYNILFKNISQKIAANSHICIINDDILNQLPFSALWNKSNGYLIENYYLYSSPSANIFKLMQERPEKKINKVTIFAAPKLVKWPDLPASRDEAGKVSKLSPGSKLFVAGQASLDNFINNTVDTDLLLISSHGRNTSNPFLSHIIFTDGKIESADVTLKASDIMLMRIPAKLVFLNCCSTAVSAKYTGTVNKSGDYFGLPQAFLSSGADSVLSAVIPLNDRAAADFSITFHEKLLINHKSILTAMRETQLFFIKNGELPSTWAGYMLYGKAGE